MAFSLVTLNGPHLHLRLCELNLDANLGLVLHVCEMMGGRNAKCRSWGVVMASHGTAHSSPVGRQLNRQHTQKLAVDVKKD